MIMMIIVVASCVMEEKRIFWDWAVAKTVMTSSEMASNTASTIAAICGIMDGWTLSTRDSVT